MNKQRENIYALRREILEGKIQLSDEDEDVVGTREYLMALAEDILDALVETYAPREADFEQWDLDALEARSRAASSRSTTERRSTSPTGRRTRSATRSGSAILQSYEEKEKLVGREVLQRVERDIMLQIVDAQWKDHLYSLDHLKEGIGLRGYGQRDPLIEYKKESFELFQAMKERVDEEIVRYLWWLRPVLERGGARRRRAGRAPRRAPLILNDPAAAAAARRSARRAPAAAPPAPSATAAPAAARASAATMRR